MRTIFTVAMLLSLAAAGPCLAQSAVAPDAGIIGPRALGAAPGSADANSPGATMPPKQARQERVQKAIPDKQARSDLQNACGGTVSALRLDAKAVWHAKCGKDGQVKAVTLGPDGITHEH